MRLLLTGLLAGMVLVSGTPAASEEELGLLRPSGAVVPALELICPLSVTEAEQAGFVRRMDEAYGFTFEGDAFTNVDGEERLEVLLTGVGCAFRLVASAEEVAIADEALKGWAADNHLTNDVSDQSVTGEEGRRIERERIAKGRLRLTWQVFDDFNGRDKPSRLEGVYSTHVH